MRPQSTGAKAGACPPRRSSRNCLTTLPTHGRPKMAWADDSSPRATAIVSSCPLLATASLALSARQAATATTGRIRSTRTIRKRRGSSTSARMNTTMAFIHMSAATGSLFALSARTNLCSVTYDSFGDVLWRVSTFFVGGALGFTACRGAAALRHCEERSPERLCCKGCTPA